MVVKLHDEYDLEFKDDDENEFKLQSLEQQVRTLTYLVNLLMDMHTGQEEHKHP